MKNNKVFRHLQCVLLLIVFLTTTIFVTPVFASGVTEISFGDVVAKVGDEVIVPVTIKNNPGFATFRFRVLYDNAALEFISVEKGGILKNGTLSSTTSFDESTMTFTWLDIVDNIGDGEIALLKFRVLPSAKGSYPLSITYLPQDFLNENSEEIPYTVQNGTVSTGCTISGTVTSFNGTEDVVTVCLLENGTEINKSVSQDGTYSFSHISPGTYIIEVSKAKHATTTHQISVERNDIVENLVIYLLGDVNCDGSINNKDVGLIQRYINGWNVEVSISIGDVNDDNIVNNKDVGLMQRYINGWDIEFK